MIISTIHESLYKREIFCEINYPFENVGLSEILLQGFNDFES